MQHEHAPVSHNIPSSQRLPGLVRYWRLWKAFVRNCFSRQLEFQVDFLVTFGAELIFQASNTALFLVIFARDEVSTLGEWGIGETLVLLGSVFIIDALMMVFIFGNLIHLPSQINKGEIDHVLLKPVDAQFFLSTRYVRPQNIMPIFAGTALVIFGVIEAGVSLDAGRIAAYLALLANGLVILYSTFFSFQCLAFWLVSAQGFEGGYFMVYNFLLKPDSIFHGILRRLLVFVVPTIIISSLPTRMLLGMEVDLWLLPWAVASALLTLVGSRIVFKRGLRRYESASS